MDFKKIAQEIYDVHRYGGRGLIANIEKALKGAFDAGRGDAVGEIYAIAKKDELELISAKQILSIAERASERKE